MTTERAIEILKDPQKYSLISHGGLIDIYDFEDELVEALQMAIESLRNELKEASSDFD